MTPMTSFRTLVTGAPPALPAALDGLAERWANTPPRLRWAAVGAVLVVALAVIGRGAVASPWGPPVSVVVAAVDLAPGHPIDPAHLRLERWPRDLATGAASDVEQLAGAVATRPLTAGEPVRLAAVDDGGLAATLAADRAAVAVVDDSLPPVTVGWTVDVVGQDFDGGAQVLAHDARVLAVDGEQVWLEVDRSEAPRVVAASARGDARLVLLPPA